MFIHDHWRANFNDKLWWLIHDFRFCGLTWKLSSRHTYWPRTSSYASNFKYVQLYSKCLWLDICLANFCQCDAINCFSGTHLILDETLLTTGQLNNNGCLNLQALTNVLTWQKVKYDFQYHVVEIPCDLVCKLVYVCNIQTNSYIRIYTRT